MNDIVPDSNPRQEPATQEQSDAFKQETLRKSSLAETFKIEKRLHAFWEYARAKAALSPEQRIDQYLQEKREFTDALKLWKPEYRRQLCHFLESHRSVDWADMAVDVMETFRSRGSLSVLDRQLELTYNANHSPSDPEFQNMRRVNHFLLSSMEAPGVERLLTVHRLAMAQDVDGLESKYTGMIRDTGVIGVELTTGLTTLEVKRINANPYLSFAPNARYNRRAEKTGRHFGDIVYPEPFTVKEAAVERIAKTAPDVYQAVLDFRSLPSAEQRQHAHEQTPEYKELTQQLVRVLLEQVYSYHAARREEVSSLDTPQKVITYVKHVALQERDAMSVHPFFDGNGRTIRAEILNDLLDKAGMSRPRLADPNHDFLLSPSGWCSQVEKGILSTDNVYKDMTHRIRMGLRIESSPELLFPDLPRTAGIHIKARGRQKVEKNVTQYPLNRAEFAAYVDARFTMDTRLEKAFRQAPLEVMGELREAYKQHAKQNLVYAYVPEKKKFGLAGLHLVDFDFRATFGTPFSEKKESWNFKIDQWYTRNLVWRGMSQEEPLESDQQIIDKFTQFSWLGLSNAMLPYWGNSQSDMRAWIQEEFDRYNESVITGTLKDVVTDHITEGDGYADSFGFSTSRKWAIGRGFAWGRGTYGYEEAEVKAAQPDIKSRVLIGGYIANKDVDVSRLRFLDPEFRYKMAQQQQEVMAVGAWDPDAIMVVQTIDSKKRVERSWVRNPDKPAEVWVIDGGADFSSIRLAELPEDTVLDRIQLQY